MLIESPELRASYAACAEEVRGFPAIWAGVEVLPAELRPYLHALNAFALRSDRIADEGEAADRGLAVARWRGETMAELRAGRSEHVLRRALVDTVRRWGLDLGLIEEYFDALETDCASAPVYETFGELRGYLRGIGGVFAELWAPLLGVGVDVGVGGDCSGLSAVGELFQLVDILEDLPVDLAAGRCYLPRADLRRLGLEVADLRRSERGAELDELMGAQLAWGRELVELAIPAIETVAAECQPFLQTVILGAQVQLDEVELLRHRVLIEGLAPPTSTKAPLPGQGPVPDHIAVIMDGNRRWAAQRGLPVAQGHRAGERALVRTVHAALRLGVRHLTVYMFSTENWNRAADELDDLFAAMAEVITRSAEWLHGCGVRIRWAGRRDRLEPSLASLLALFESMTSNNSALTLTLCIDYGGRDELAAAARALAAEAVAGAIRPEEIGPDDVARHLYAPELPDVDLLIRTSGEQRVSNFLLWQLAYAELVFDPALWPDFGLGTLRRAIGEYVGRRRTFGGDLVHQRDAMTGALESAGSTKRARPHALEPAGK